MCFSATASFGVSIALLGVGAAALKQVTAPRQYLFAAIPLIFAFQQFIEGVVWLSLTDPSYEQFQRSSPYAYLIFAHAVWPIGVPLAIFLLEKDKMRKRMLALLIGIGTVVATIFMYYVFTKEAFAGISGHHIYYDLRIPFQTSIFSSMAYCLVTVFPAFISSVRKMKWLGWSSLASLFVSIVYFEENLISVWCFFAAIISVVVLAIMQRSSTVLKTKLVAQ